MPGQVRDDQPHGHRITRPPPGPVNELNRAAHDDRAFGPVAAEEPETIAGPHRTLLDEPGDDSAAAGDREDIVDPEPEPVRRLVANAPILSEKKTAAARTSLTSGLRKASAPMNYRP